MSTPSIQTLITQAQQVLNLKSTNEIRATLAAVLANANVGTPLNPNLTTQQLWDEFYEIVRQPSDDIMSIVVDQMMRMVFSPPAPGGAGANGQVIFNDMGVLAGDSKFLWDKNANRLDVDGPVVITGDLTVATSVLKVDSTNNRVGIGTASPYSTAESLNARTTSLTNIAAFATMPLTVTDSTAFAEGVGGGINFRAKVTSAAYSNYAAIWSYRESATNSDYAGSLIFGTSDNTDGHPEERMRITASGNVSIANGNVVMATSGKGIDFSATANSSGTMTSELLNDYEEGTWTGTITGNGGTNNPTIPVTATGRYTKVGRQVSVQIAFEGVSTAGASGSVGISGLPFANTALRTIGTAGTFLGATFTGTLISNISQSSNLIEFYGVISNIPWAAATHNPNVGTYFWVNITYTV
jgi:hypothetical protein